MAAKSVCKIEGCGKLVVARGMCERHYRRDRKYGDPTEPDQRFRPQKTCKVEGCDGDAGWKAGGKLGYCQKHAARFYRHGDPLFLGRASNGELEAWLRSHVDYTGDECLIWPFASGPKGYAERATVDGIPDYAHRHMCALAHGPQPSPQHEVAHSCGNGTGGCVHPLHVRWDTHQSNMDDQIIHGTRLSGERVRTSKLTEDDVRAIREQAKTMMQKEIAAIYGVNRATIGAILRGKSWGWLK